MIGAVVEGAVDQPTKKMPQIGCTVAFSPCTECFEIMERGIGVYQGHRQECNTCRNVLMSVALEKGTLAGVTSPLDRFRALERTERTDEIIDVLFASSIPAEKAADWLAANGFAGFVDKGVENKGSKGRFRRFSKIEDAKVDIYVPFEKGIFGRYTSRETPVKL